MLPKIVARRADQIRALLGHGALAGASVPLRNGGTLPAKMFARVALDDLAYLSRLAPGGDEHLSGMSWQRLAEDIELLHEVALGREYARIEQSRDRVPG